MVNFNHGAPLNDTSSIVYEDHVVTKFIKDRVGLPPQNFGIVQPTRPNIDLSLAKSDKVEVCPRGDPLWTEAVELTKHHFRHMNARFNPVPMEQVLLDPGTAAGFPFREHKQEALQHHYQYFAWYCLPGNRDRPMPIFSVTGKVEYLPMEEIENDKIRLFRNPPLDYLLLEKMYFQEQEAYLLSHPHKTWVALGFTKENGGWHRFVENLRTENHHSAKERWYYRWDIGKWDNDNTTFL